MSVQPTSTNVPGALHVSVPDDVFTPVAAKMSSQADQVVNDLAVNVVVLYDTEVYESAAGIVDLANDRFVIPTDGIYLITYLVEWANADPAVDSVFTITVFVGGVAIGAGTARNVFYTPADGKIPGTQVVSTAAQFSAGDLVSFRVSQVSQAAQTINQTEATIQRVA